MAFRKERRHLVGRGLPRPMPGIGRHVGVLGGHSIAEAGRRHAALEPRRIAGRRLGLASLGRGVKSCRKLGLRRPSRGTSGGPCGRRSGASLSVDGGTCWWKAPWARTAASFGWGAGTRALASAARLGMLGTGCGKQQRASASRIIRREQGRQRPLELRARDTAHPRRGDGLAAAGSRSTNCGADPRLETPAMAIQRRRGWLRADGWAPTQAQARRGSRRARAEARGLGMA